MYDYYLDGKLNAPILRSLGVDLFGDSIEAKLRIARCARPVFAQELDAFGFDKFFRYDSQSERPILWSEINSYFYRGKKIARVTGGGFGEDFKLEVLDDAPSELEAVDLDAFRAANGALVDKMVDETVKKIENYVADFARRGYRCYISYSGGKDSDVLLDLLLRSSLVKDVPVIYCDTRMELPPIYEHVKKVAERVRGLGGAFEVAKSDLDPRETWRIFGAPSRKLRWCCYIHKSTPLTLKAREIFGHSAKVANICGVRADESPARSKYEETSVGRKVNAVATIQPLLKWSTTELWSHILVNNVEVSSLYRMGFARVGCTVCAMSGGRCDRLAEMFFPDEITFYRNVVEEQDCAVPQDRAALDKLWRLAGWRGRANGSYLRSSQKKIFRGVRRVIDGVQTDLYLRKGLDVEMLLEWLKCLGKVERDGANVTVKIGSETRRLEFVSVPQEFADGATDLTLIVVPLIGDKESDHKFTSAIKRLSNRSLFCVGCRSCEANCPRDVISFVNRRPKVDESRCVHCRECVDEKFTNAHGCWVAKSTYCNYTETREHVNMMLEKRVEKNEMNMTADLYDSQTWFDRDLTDPEWYEKVLNATNHNA